MLNPIDNFFLSVSACKVCPILIKLTRKSRGRHFIMQRGYPYKRVSSINKINKNNARFYCGKHRSQRNMNNGKRAVHILA